MSTTDASRLPDIARAGLAAAGIGRGERILVALSAGPDSTALASVLAALAGELPLSLTACIVDHGIRAAEEIDGDIACARELCARIGVPLLVRRVAPGACEAEARREGRSLEEVARRNRLALLEEAARETGCGAIALGHTRDDALETILMRALCGAGPLPPRGSVAATPTGSRRCHLRSSGPVAAQTPGGGRDRPA